MVGMLAWEVLHMHDAISREHLQEVTPDLCFCRDPEEIEKEQAAAEKAVAKEECQGEGLLQLLSSLPLGLKSRTGPKARRCPSEPMQQFPPEDWSAAPTAQASDWVGTTTEWSSAGLPHILKQNVIRSMENKVSKNFLKKESTK